MPNIEFPSTTALVVVDVQAGTLPNARAVSAENLVSHVGSLVEAFRGSGRPVAFVVSTGTASGVTDHGPGGRVWPEGFAELAPGIDDRGDEPVHPRAGWSAFAGTSLLDDLTAAQITDIVVVGLATTFGVESTARDAADLGFSVVVVSDAVSDPDPSGHERSLTRVFPALGRVRTTAEVLAAI
ncbi:nicotinamidase-related amidase [Microbacterium phyllosphaerae]|uniref:Nicotinamidase-related amidase n=1 Tax=Microbacterium phyllosphaerae TaxID=124798 RepID=A0ABS4WU62_9MICO|nr:isochorismatase family protein [Microbacterium phyllosphaerae]MBP2379757.1 nicotinamidase-related amidase [Microbacterium phyllosphaerae]